MLRPDIPTTAAAVAGYGLAARLRAGPVAGFAFDMRRYFDVDRVAFNGLLKRQLELVAQVGTAKHLAATAAASRTAKNIAKHIAENVTEGIGAAGTAKSASGRALNSLMAESVVRGSLIRIAQDLISFLGFLELGLALGIVLLRSG